MKRNAIASSVASISHEGSGAARDIFSSEESVASRPVIDKASSSATINSNNRMIEVKLRIQGTDGETVSVVAEGSDEVEATLKALQKLHSEESTLSVLKYAQSTTISVGHRDGDNHYEQNVSVTLCCNRSSEGDAESRVTLAGSGKTVVEATVDAVENFRKTKDVPLLNEIPT